MCNKQWEKNFRQKTKKIHNVSTFTVGPVSYLLARPRALSEPAPAKAATALRLGSPALCQHLGSVQLAMPLRCLPYKWQPRCAQIPLL